MSVFLATSLSGRAAVTVTVEHNEGEAATGVFHFPTVPAPRPSAALVAAFKVVDGKSDDNSAPSTCCTTTDCPMRTINRMLTSNVARAAEDEATCDIDAGVILPADINDVSLGGDDLHFGQRQMERMMEDRKQMIPFAGKGDPIYAWAVRQLAGCAVR